MQCEIVSAGKGRREDGVGTRGFISVAIPGQVHFVDSGRPPGQGVADKADLAEAEITGGVRCAGNAIVEYPSAHAVPITDLRDARGPVVIDTYQRLAGLQNANATIKRIIDVGDRPPAWIGEGKLIAQRVIS